jgi:capsule biosynthesis phosphatase
VTTLRICVDLDGVICELRRPGQSYADLNPVEGAVERMRSLRAAGHYLIIYTARHMKTCDGNVGQVVARQGLTTLEWLERHGIEYDEIHFGKPHADVYLDDNAVRFDGWAKLADDDSSFPPSAETAAARSTW